MIFPSASHKLLGFLSSGYSSYSYFVLKIHGVTTGIF